MNIHNIFQGKRRSSTENSVQDKSKNFSNNKPSNEFDLDHFDEHHVNEKSSNLVEQPKFEVETSDGKTVFQNDYNTKVDKKKIDQIGNSLFLWAKSLITDDIMHIESFDDFRSGKVFVALIYLIDPSIIELEEFDTTDPYRTLEAAFCIAEEYFGFPNFLNPHEVVRGKKEDKLILYIYLFKNKLDSIYSYKNNQEMSYVHELLRNLKRTIVNKVTSAEALFNAFKEECICFAALETEKEMNSERVFLENQIKALMDTMDQMNLLNSELGTQNSHLRESINLHKEKIKDLEMRMDSEKRIFEKYQQERAIEDEIFAFFGIDYKKDMEKYIMDNKERLSDLSEKLKKYNLPISK